MFCKEKFEFRPGASDDTARELKEQLDRQATLLIPLIFHL
jgi:hypothetical protein